MNEKLTKRLLDLKARQEAGEHMPCPRCGRDTMKPDVYTNALSRSADIMVCDECGLDEAKLAFMRNPMPLYQWASLQPDKPASDFEARPGADVWDEIQRTQASRLIRLYERWQTHEECDDELRFESFETFPGMTELWFEPFQAAYDTADGRLLLRFRKTSHGAEIAADLIPRK